MRSIALLLVLVLHAPNLLASQRLNIGITQYPSTFHPLFDPMLAKAYVLGATLRTLTAYDADWQLVCVLCQQLPTLANGMAREVTLDNGEEGMEIEYVLDTSWHWADGTPLTGHDLRLSWEIGRHPDTGVIGAEMYRRILRFDVLDTQRIRVQLDRRTYDYNALPLTPLPSHLEDEIFRANPAGYRQASLYERAPETAGLYLGPYRIASMRRGSVVKLLPNEYWQGPEPFFTPVQLRAIGNSAALEANLLSQRIDMIAGELGLGIDRAHAFAQRHGHRFAVQYQPGLFYEHIDIMLDNPHLADRRVRQALLMGIDRELINTVLFQGKLQVAHGPLHPLDAMYSDDFPHYAFDPQGAAARLDESGWRLDATGVRRNAAGEALRFDLMTTAGNRSREMVQQVLQQQWADLGIEVSLRNEPARIFFGQTLDQRRFKGLAMFAWISSPQSVPRTILHSQEIPTAANNWSGQNYPGLRDARTDALLDAIEIELDPEVRRALWAELQQRYATELPALPLFFRTEAYVLPRWLTGLRPSGHQYPSTMGIEHWRRQP